MIFDAHCDIWTDVTHHHLAGERDIFRRYHYERLKKGGITGGIFVIWNDPPYDKDPLKRTHQMMEAIAQEEKDCADILKVCRSFRDMDEAIKDGKMYAFIGLEGLKSIGEDVDRIDEFYQFGARHASLTWNEENPLATGARGNPDRGLTDLGKKAVRKIQDLGMILDMSHINDKSFWDVMYGRTAEGACRHRRHGRLKLLQRVCPSGRVRTDRGQPGQTPDPYGRDHGHRPRGVWLRLLRISGRRHPELFQQPGNALHHRSGRRFSCAEPDRGDPESRIQRRRDRKIRIQELARLDPPGSA